jgi:hypothetical protein
MILLPGFESASEPRPRVPWVTGTVVFVLVGLMAGSIAINVLSGLLWPSGKETAIAPAESAPRNDKIIEQYTRFRTEPISGGEVVTGYRYASSADAAPEEQYCYLMTGKEGSGVRYKLVLANKNRSGIESYGAIMPEDAAQLGISAKDAAVLAREHCRFDQWE